MITCCNLISGCIATVFGIYAEYEYALLFIIIGAVFDFFDGFAARLLHVSSPIGKELDSLADVVTFGVAPSAMLFTFFTLVLHVGDTIIPYQGFFAFLMAAFSALRLAKFNLDERQSLGFIGLPTPANALFWGALIVGSGKWISEYQLLVYATILLFFVCCYLLISEIPMFALKFKHWGWRGNEVKYIFLISCLPILLFLRTAGLSVVIAWYVLLSVCTQHKQ